MDQPGDEAPSTHAPPTRLQGRRLEGTFRMEAFSDGVMAIIVTLLIFEIAVPVLDAPDNTELLEALGDLLPKFLSFAVSFFILTIFWVNHHHFLYRITHSDWKLLWYNNGLLFWLAVIPFSTAFIGDYPDQPVAIAFYSLNLSLASLAFVLMAGYVFFRGKLIDPSLRRADLVKEYRRSWMGTSLFAGAAILAFVSVPATLAILIAAPFAWVVPGLVRSDDED